MSADFDKLLAAQDTLHTARALLTLCEEKAFALCEALPEHEKALDAIARSIELSSKLVLDAVQIADGVSFNLKRLHHDRRA